MSMDYSIIKDIDPVYKATSESSDCLIPLDLDNVEVLDFEGVLG
jgi:hypothetical protein